MKYHVHRLEIKEDTAQEKLENYLNRLEGEILSVIPMVTPAFRKLGAASVVKFFLIVEKTK